MKLIKFAYLAVLAANLMLLCSSAFAYSGYYAPFLGGTSQRVTQDSNGTTSHYGAGQGYAIDFAGSFNVYSTKDGVVDRTGEDSYKIQFCKNNPQYWHGPAKYVRIKHDDGYYSYYYHFNTIKVSKGDKVKRGETILGVSGNTGCSTNSHLHFQLSTAASMNRKYSVDVVFEDIGKPKSGNTYRSGNYPNKSGNYPVQTSISYIRVYCPSSVSENTSSAGNCTAKAYYSNGTNKDITSSASWSDNSSKLRVYSSGRLKTYSVSYDVNVTVTATYGNQRYSALVRVKNGSSSSSSSSNSGKSLDGKDPNTTSCDRDAKTVAEKNMSYGKVQLRWSNSCKTNWTRVKPNSSSYRTYAYLWRSSDRKQLFKSGYGTIWTPMLYAPNIRACARGYIYGYSSWTCR
ncbi:conserved hypothetical protein, secreted [Beggiatoa sp. PS]|nr:conserved hypothetical protein, secreted [Beggiatoa sp. PS]